MKIVIDGLIGAGKSTQVDILSKTLGISTIREPIDEWPLELFYSDPKRWGFLMQVAVLNSFVKLRHTDGIFERSPESTRCVFWQNLVDSGMVNSTENEVFNALYDNVSWLPDITILIDKSPELCYEHIQKRTQAGDSKITLEYLKKLNSYYDDFKKMPEVVVVDGNRSISEVSEDIIKTVRLLQHERAMQVHNGEWSPM
jgi:deoxyadenosine/deoxycytidine kinase